MDNFGIYFDCNSSSPQTMAGMCIFFLYLKNERPAMSRGAFVAFKLDL